MVITPILGAVIGAALPFTPLAHFLGFTALPISFFLILLGMIAAYLVLVEFAKSRFYAAHTHPHPTPPSARTRDEHRVARRAARFTRYHQR
jgi:Mg2+-importing ATPase